MVTGPSFRDAMRFFPERETLACTGRLKARTATVADGGLHVSVSDVFRLNFVSLCSSA